MTDAKLAGTAVKGYTAPEFQDELEPLYVRLLGDPRYVNQHQFLQARVTNSACVQIFVYAPSEDFDWWTMLTSGMSETAQYDDDGDAFRSELIAFTSDEPSKSHLAALRFAAQFPSLVGASIGWGHSISPNNPPGPIVPGGSAERLWLLSPPVLPREDFDEDLVLSDQTAVELFWVGALTGNEWQFKREHGSEALIEQFPEDDDSWLVLDFERKSVLD